MGASIAAVLSIALGIGLAAATGFRVFIPLLVAGAAARAGWIPLSDGFSWLAATPAPITLGAGNPVVSTAETVGATGLSILAITLPILCVIVVIVLWIWVVRSTRRLVLRLRDRND